MTALWAIFRLILRDQRTAMIRGATLSLVVLVMGVALLGLSGWFITAAAAAGLAGLGAVFDVFRPSAMVRFLALGRAAARYGERVLTHDATLRALESLRMRVLATHLSAPYSHMIRIRGAQALNRLTADIDALDGVPLRLVLPLLAGGLAQAIAFAALWWLVAPIVAIWTVGGYVLGAAVIFGRMAMISVPLSRQAERAAQAFRTRLIDMIRARRDLVVYGRLTSQAALAMTADARRQSLRHRLDAAERWAAAALTAVGGGVAAGALGIGMTLVQSGSIGPGFAALGFFAALALAETLAPLRRAIADLGRMADAARRVGGGLVVDEVQVRRGTATGVDLRLWDVTLHRPGTMNPVLSHFTLTLKAGETVAITGASGSGKSTLLLAVAGLHPVAAGAITLGGLAIGDWPEADLRDVLTLLPQRSTLMAGTISDALQLAAKADEAQLWEVLRAVRLEEVIRAKGGLDARLGSGGEGLSGGEARRLTLARTILRRPRILLLDEPTEGLDDATAAAVLHGLREALPKATLLIAAHRKVETDFADRVQTLR